MSVCVCDAVSNQLLCFLMCIHFGYSVLSWQTASQAKLCVTGTFEQLTFVPSRTCFGVTHNISVVGLEVVAVQHVYVKL